MKNKPFLKLCLSTLGTLLSAELICILSMFLAFSLVKSNPWGLILFGVAGCLLFYGMLYGSLWYEGNEDRNRVNFGHMKKDLYRGLKVGLVLMIPYAVVVLVSLIEKLTGSFGFLAIYKLVNAHFWTIFNVVTRTGLESPMYYMETSQISWPILLIFWSTIFLLPLLGGIAYLCGYKGISFKSFIVYKKTDKEE